jgi:hypothetical protein
MIFKAFNTFEKPLHTTTLGNFWKFLFCFH